MIVIILEITPMKKIAELYKTNHVFALALTVLGFVLYAATLIFILVFFAVVFTS